MDSLTHTVAGALTPIAFANSPKRASLILFGVLAGQLPDLDVFFGSSAEFLLTKHRGITHAIAWQPFLVLALVLPFAIFFASQTNKSKCLVPESFPKLTPEQSKVSFLKLFYIGLLAVFVHLFLDSLNGFGTQLFLPFSDARIGLNSVFIIDFLLTLPALFFLTAALFAAPAPAPEALQGSWLKALRSRSPIPVPSGCPKFFSSKSQAFARIGIAWLIVYPLVAITVHAGMQQLYTKLWNLENKQLTLMAEPFSPFVWKAVINDDSVYRVGTLFTFDLKAKDMLHQENAWHTVAKIDTKLYEQLERQSNFFTYFRKFSLDMYQIVSSGEFASTTQGSAQKIHRYIFGDLRYLISPQSAAHYFGHSDANFQLEAEVLEDGTLVAYRFLDRGRNNDTQWILP